MNKQRGEFPRVSVSFTLQQDILEKYKEYCRVNAINQSAKVEQLIKQFLQIK